MTEIWKPVVGYEGQYDVSSLGRVRSHVAKKPLLVLSQYRRKDGYLQVQLKVNQKPQNRLVHTLVDEAFNGPRVSGLEVNHVDGDKRNNDIGNLQRVTHQENVRHAWDSGLCEPVIAALKTPERREAVRVLGLRRHQSGGLVAMREAGAEAIRKKSRRIVCSQSDGSQRFTADSVKDAAAACGVRMADVCNVTSGRQKTSHGWAFAYLENNGGAPR